MRRVQDCCEGRAVADRLEQHRMRRAFNDDDRRFIERVSFFFVATASAQSVDCSFKCGAPGFVRVTGENTLVCPCNCETQWLIWLRSGAVKVASWDLASALRMALRILKELGLKVVLTIERLAPT